MGCHDGGIRPDGGLPPDPGHPVSDPGEPGEDDGADPMPTTSDASTSGGEVTTSPMTTGDDSTDATGGESMCGDGVQAADEMCDDGDANSDNAFCTEQCHVNVCGDGLKFEGVELCDEGEGNSDRYGNFCDASCAPGIFCGDHILQDDEGEECDHGPANGMMDDDEGDIPCSATCRLVARRGFVTDEAFTGDLGGLEGADEKCRVAAFKGGLANPEWFHAFLSTVHRSR
jgi:hypothetical protein